MSDAKSPDPKDPAHHATYLGVCDTYRGPNSEATPGISLRLRSRSDPGTTYTFLLDDQDARRLRDELSRIDRLQRDSHVGGEGGDRHKTGSTARWRRRSADDDDDRSDEPTSPVPGAEDIF